MEDRKFIVKNKEFILFFIVLNTVFLFSYIFAYSPYYTHPDLTEEIARLFNLKNSNQDIEISQNEIQWMRQGAIDEDTPPRWINHFYDPVHKDGWLGKHFGDQTQEQGLYEGESMAPRPAIASIDWVTNQEYQSAYGRQYGNQTWQKAIKLYIDDDKKSSFIALGHILHLIEDVSVPDHTRNDTHADIYGDPGSPYEKYSKEYTNFNKLNIAENLKSKELYDFSTIQSAFEYLANYSNNNFFSEDTISNEEFESPNLGSIKEISKLEDNIIHKYLIFNGTYLASVKSENRLTGEKIYSTDDKSFVLPSYFFNLSPQAVLTGASVMDLFFKEVEKYKKNPELLPIIIQDSNEAIISYLGKSPRLAIVGAADLKDRIETNASIYVSKAKIGIQSLVSNFNEFFSKSENLLATTANIGQVAIQTELGIKNQELRDSIVQLNEVEPPQEAQPLVGRRDNPVDEVQPRQLDEIIIHAPYQRPKTEEKIEIIHAPYGGDKVDINQNVPIVIMSTGGGGGSAGNSNQPATSSSVSSEQTTSPSTDSSDPTQEDATPSTDQGETPSTDTGQPTITEDLTPPPAPIITTNSGADYIIKKFTSQYPERKISLALEGTKSQDTSEILINSSSESVNYPTQTNWGKDFVLSEGENIFETRAKDIAGNISELATIKITLQFSDIGFYLTKYDVRKFDFTLNWQDSLGVVNSWQLQYKLGPNFDWENINLANSEGQIANSYNFTAKYDDLTYYFRIQGSDINGNLTDWQYLQADISSKPVVISEVAWMGTQASTTDEWIELANKTDQEIDLSGWILKTSDSAINIKLTGKIAPNGFYLLERTNDDPISNIAADQSYTGALNNPTGSYDYGQNLQLYDKNSNEVDSVYSAHAGLNDTSAPNNPIRKTSERISVWATGSIKSNWKTYQGSGGEAQDAGGNKILGTPKAKNSQADLYFPVKPSWIINQDTIFLKNRGPYAADYYAGAIEIAKSATLNIEPGTVLKFGYYGELNILGGLMAKGTSENKIVFTSYDDDEYGGDSESNGQTAITNWMKINFKEGSSGNLNYAIVRYGGNPWSNEAVYVNKASVKISNSVFENMGKDAVHFDNSDVDISSSEFKNNNGNAVYIYGSKGNISGNIFDNNKESGVLIGAPSGRINIVGNSFTKNKAPIRLNSFGDFSIDLNQVSNNNYNGILVYASSGLDAGNILLSADMPFVIMGFPTIQSGATLEIVAGTIIKFDITDFHGLTVEGALKAVGTQENPIVFTSLYDDQYGGDTNNDAVATAPRPGLWAWINFSGSENSVIENTIIKYGGQIRNSMGGPPSGGSGISVDSGVSNFTFRNSTISDSVIGMTISSDGAIIEDSTFSNNNLISDDNGMTWRGGIGLDVLANNVKVSNAVFNNNGKAFQSSSTYMATILLSNLIFNQNTYNYWPEGLLP